MTCRSAKARPCTVDATILQLLADILENTAEPAVLTKKQTANEPLLRTALRRFYFKNAVEGVSIQVEDLFEISLPSFPTVSVPVKPLNDAQHWIRTPAFQLLLKCGREAGWIVNA